MSERLSPAISGASRRPCPVCKACRGEFHLEKAALCLVQCRVCGMVYADPVPERYASGEYYNQEATAYYLSPEKLQADYSPVRFLRELRLFRRWCRSGSVLDVGCSSGGFLHQLNRQFPGNYSILGTDVSQAPLDYAASRGIPVLNDNFLAHDFGKTRFDAITFWAVLEHLAEPDKFLAKAQSLLHRDGLCFVLVPNYAAAATRILGARYRYIYPQHLNYFTRSTLQRFCHTWRVEFMGTSHFNPVVIWQDWRSGGVEVSNQSRGALLRTTTRLKSNPALAPVRAMYGILEHGLARLGLADNLVAVLRPPVGPG